MYLESQDSYEELIKFKELYQDHDQDAKLKSGTCSILQSSDQDFAPSNQCKRQKSEKEFIIVQINHKSLGTISKS